MHLYQNSVFQTGQEFYSFIAISTIFKRYAGTYDQGEGLQQPKLIYK